MPIRKRLSGNGPEDAAIRDALRVAIAGSDRRIEFLNEEIATGTSFDTDETQKEIDTIRRNLAVWKRIAAMEGKLRVGVDAS